MKLYYMPGACSFAPHIALHELGLPFELVKVDGKTKTFASGTDFHSINPKGYVPVLQLDDGQILTEGVAILQYLADQKPAAKLAPAFGTFERYRLIEVLNYITTEIHKGFSPLFGADRMVSEPAGNEQLKAWAAKNLLNRLSWFDQLFSKQEFVMGDHFTVADAYLTTVLRWSYYVKLDLSSVPNVKSYLARVQDRPSVQATIRAEGLKG